MEEKATALFAKKNQVFFAYNRHWVHCSRRKLHLMRQHDLDKLFKRGNKYHVQYLFSHYNGNETLIPVFRHPHDLWVKKHGLMNTHDGNILAVNHGDDAFHLLVELAPNVLGFAECVDFDKNSEKVRFVPYRYNRKTKKIYGYLE